MKIVTVLGARPQFIKAATVSRACAAAGVHEVIVHTGQHYDANMSQVFFDEMDIPAPHYRFDINSLAHGAMTGRMMEKVEDVLMQEKPDCVLIYGDTNSTLAGALAAVKLHIPVAHVEAGLRSFEMRMPEEVNRILADRISKWLFCPTQTAVDNLQREGYGNFPCTIIKSGDVMFDAVQFYRLKANASNARVHLQLGNGPFVLATLHRAENTNDTNRLAAIADALNEIATYATVVLPLHPRTREYLQKNDIALNAKIVEPLGYFHMLSLLHECQLVLTDSGGLQKEAYFFGKYCITLRDQTEWVELVDVGANTLAGADTGVIVEAFQKHRHTTVNVDANLYGDGRAAEKIVAELQSSM